MEFPTGVGATSGPISPDAWKRAVYRSAPPRFYVEFLPQEKQGSSYSYGLRICPIKDDGASISTRGSGLGYDIWRKWEDCLTFQETLEVEYSRMARAKRNRLAAGRGIKKNGVYINSDQAASFESLPPGPDPHSVAQNIHDYIPKLTKKGTIFRASQATIEQRQSEFQAMISALFEEDVPMLIREMRSTRIFTDFFGFWRRDHDLARKSGKDPASMKSRGTVTSSVLSAHFSASSPSFLDMLPSPTRQGSQRHSSRRLSNVSDTSSSGSSVTEQIHRKTTITPGYGHVPDSTPSSRSTSASGCSPTLPSLPATPPRQFPRQPVIANQEVPIQFGHVPESVISERPTSMLESLPEDCELPSGAAGKSADQGIRTRRRAGSTASEVNRNARIYGSPPRGFDALSEFGEQTSHQSSLSRTVRQSWQTTCSTASSRAAAYLEELGVDYSLPSPHPESYHRPRASMCSMASVITEARGDAIVPRSPQFHSPMDRRRPVSFPEDESIFANDEPWVDDDESDQADDLLDAYFYVDSICLDSPTQGGLPETPTIDSFPFLQTIPTRHSTRRASLAPSVSSWSTSSSHEGTVLSIKAMHEESIIMLRVPRILPFAELRKKIYDKFVQQEKSPISESFAIAVLVHPSTDRTGSSQGRRGSLSSCDSKRAVLQFVTSQEEWDQAVSRHGTKLLLRIIGSRE
ncbi:hypothetical protein ID866_3971 [Astraeus odoratus]|nr:hypothetical protein ID866_3971 [Astraeus odoratus]